MKRSTILTIVVYAVVLFALVFSNIEPYLNTFLIFVASVCWLAVATYCEERVDNFKRVTE